MSNRKQIFIFWPSLLMVLLLDQVTKAIAAEYDLVSLNTGISFSLFSEASVFLHISLTILALGVIGWGMRDFWRKQAFIAGVGSGAALSNLFDRVVYGGVRDFLPVPILNVHNNVADWVIAGCVVCIIVVITQNREHSSSR